MGYLSLKLFDGFQAYLDGKHLTGFESDKSRALLAYLTVENNRTHRREKLASLLWPDMPEKRARASLSQALYNLRALLGERDSQTPIFKVNLQQVQLCNSDHYEVDVCEFLRLYQSSEQHSHRQIETCAHCAAQLQEALDQYKGRFLEGFSIPDSQSFEEWMLLVRERLQHQVEKALHTLANCHSRQNNYPKAIEYARKQIELDPWRESAHRQLMQFLAIDGQRNAALAQFKTCCTALSEELNVEPQAKTIELFNQIRDGEIIHAPYESPPHNLPAPLTSFVGREAEVKKLRQYLNDPAYRLISLIGVGGSGKTRLALEAARCELHSYPQGVFLVSLAPLRSVTAIDPTAAEALGIIFRESEDPHRQLLETFRKQSMLLIMDNFEHLLDGVDWVLELLRFAPNVTVLATSRTRLNVKGEHIMYVEGLDFPEGDTGLLSRGCAEEYSAIRLFVDTAQRIHPGFEFSQKIAPEIVRICQLVQGIPLAILLAAGGMDVFAPNVIADQINKSFDILDSEWRDLPLRQRSMRAVLDHSWAMLNKQEREAMQALSIFRGGFTRGAAEYVAGILPQTLQGLLNKIFLTHSTKKRFDIHELTRQYAAEKLASNKTMEAKICYLHAEFYVDTIRRWENERKISLAEDAIASIDLESENIRVAWDWIVQNKEISLIAQGIEGLCIYYDARVRYADGQIACQNAVEVLNMNNCDSHILTSVRSKAWLAHFSRQLDDTEFAKNLLEECFGLLSSNDLRDSNDKQALKAFIQLEQGYLTLLSDRHAANRWFQESLNLYQSIGDAWGENQSWRGLAKSPLTWAVAVNRARSEQKSKDR